jgi:selenide,water dikinase
VGLERPDDAGVYRLTDELALVQTVDFFTPLVDDPEAFGRIAAANAMSDVWAMGGRPLTALNVVCFPSGRMAIDLLRQVLRGGLEAMREAGCALLGGHSVDDPELKYGLAVTGVVHPERFLTSLGARSGDRLVLTKPLGTGVIATAVKGGLATEEAARAARSSMAALNRRASELMLERGAVACTDVTGFGLVGHALEMVRGSPMGLALRARALPILPGALELAGDGLLPAGLHRNREFYSARVEVDPGLAQEVSDIVHDPQTSGGLLVALGPGAAERFAEDLRRSGEAASESAAVIGEFTKEGAGRVVVRP